ncbi:hypothetical protein D3C78_1025350 [compost metagenome]
MGLVDQVQHQIDGRGAAGRGDASAVDFEQFLGDAQLWIRLLEGLDSFPVQGHPMAVQQAGFGEHNATGVDPAEGHAVVIQAVQPVFQCRVDELQRFEAGDHQ